MPENAPVSQILTLANGLQAESAVLSNRVKKFYRYVH